MLQQSGNGIDAREAQKFCQYFFSASGTDSFIFLKFFFLDQLFADKIKPSTQPMRG